MPLRRSLPLLTALAVLAALAAVAAPGAARVEQVPGTFTGADGLLYESAPAIVAGEQGYLFVGSDFDLACGLGSRLDHSLKAYAKLAKVISRSGRRVVFTVAPDKTAVLSDELPAQTPHGPCDLQGLAAQGQLLDKFGDADFLPLVEPLRGSPRQVYWHTDLHWTTVGGAVFAKALAAHLSPRLGREQRYTYGTESRLGEMNLALGISTLETVQTATPVDKVRVRTAPGGPDWSGYPEFTFEHAWNTTPAQRTWPGHTLLLGDSFMWYALENLRPVFRHGHFVWLDHTGTDLPQAIKGSDTVVIELLQLFMPSAPILTPQFRHQVARALS